MLDSDEFNGVAIFSFQFSFICICLLKCLDIIFEANAFNLLKISTLNIKCANITKLHFKHFTCTDNPHNIMEMNLFASSESYVNNIFEYDFLKWLNLENAFIVWNTNIGLKEKMHIIINAWDWIERNEIRWQCQPLNEFYMKLSLYLFCNPLPNLLSVVNWLFLFFLSISLSSVSFSLSFSPIICFSVSLRLVVFFPRIIEIDCTLDEHWTMQKCSCGFSTVLQL